MQARKADLNPTFFWADGRDSLAEDYPFPTGGVTAVGFPSNYSMWAKKGGRLITSHTMRMKAIKAFSKYLLIQRPTICSFVERGPQRC